MLPEFRHLDGEGPNIGARVAQPAKLHIEGLIFAVEPFLAALGNRISGVCLLHPMGQLMDEDAFAGAVVKDVEAPLQIYNAAGREKGVDGARPSTEPGL